MLANATDRYTVDRMGVEVPTGYGMSVYRWRCAGILEDACVTLGYEPGGSTDAEEHADELHAALLASGLITNTNMCAGWSYQGTVTYYQSATGVFQGGAGSVVIGTASSAPMPANCCFLVNKLTARGGRKGKGRMYLPACYGGEHLVEPTGVVSSALVTSTQTKLTAWYNAIVAGAANPVLFHSDGSTPDTILSFSLATTIGTQRRRIR